MEENNARVGTKACIKEIVCYCEVESQYVGGAAPVTLSPTGHDLPASVGSTVLPASDSTLPTSTRFSFRAAKLPQLVNLANIAPQVVTSYCLLSAVASSTSAAFYITE